MMTSYERAIHKIFLESSLGSRVFGSGWGAFVVLVASAAGDGYRSVGEENYAIDSRHWNG